MKEAAVESKKKKKGNYPSFERKAQEPNRKIKRKIPSELSRH